MGYKVHTPAPSLPDWVFGVGILIIAVLVAIACFVGPTKPAVQSATAELQSPCSVSYNRDVCLDYVERKVLQSIAKMTFDDYTFETRVGLLQALATMHCPIQTEKP